MRGVIRHKCTKGYAFIRRESVNDNPVQDIFLHISEFFGDWDQLKAGDHVEFTPGVRRNNPIAVDVRLLAEPSEEVTSGVYRGQQ
jgi:cold shock CspA family protein